MIRPFEKEDLPVLMDLWLSANMDAHAFIPASYWAEHAGQVRTQLPRAEVYVCQQDAAAPISKACLSKKPAAPKAWAGSC